MVIENVTRIRPFEPPFPTDVAEQLAAMMPPGEPPIALFRTFAHNLPMTRAMHGWGSYELSRHLTVSMRLREIVIDRTCARCGCEYEWGVHVERYARRVALTDEQVRSLTHGDASDCCWEEPREVLAIRVVDTLHDHGDVDDALWSSLTAAFTDAELLDIVMLTGWYHAISFVARSTRIPLERAAPRFVEFP